MLILGDTGGASAFVVATPRKLQADELASVRLFQENTRSIVYITNLAVRYAHSRSLASVWCASVLMRRLWR